MLKFLNNISIRKRFVGIFLCLLLIFAASTVIFLGEIQGIYQTNFQKNMESNASQLVSNIESELQQWCATLDILVNDEALYAFLTQRYDRDYDAYQRYMEIANSLSITRQNGYISDFRIYSGNDSLRISAITNNPLSRIDKEPWFHGFEEIKTYNWSFLRPSLGLNRDQFCLYKYRRDIYTGEVYIYALFIQEKALSSLLSEEIEAGRRFMIVDDQNTIICSTDKTALGTTLENQGYLDQKSGQPLFSLPSGQTVSYEDKEYYLQLSQVKNAGINIQSWRVLQLIPTTQLNRDLKQMYLIGFSGLSLGLAVILVLLIALLASISNRLHRLNVALDQMRRGHLGDLIKVTGTDEIGSLERHFNSATGTLKSLFEDVKDASQQILYSELENQRLSKLNREAELIALRHQINPHYLFNTFETIRMSLIQQDMRDLAKIIRAFSETFRMVYHTSKENHTLESELKLIESFMEVQHFRHGEKFTYHLEVDPSLLGCTIPLLCIQPLVENAVFYGVEGCLDKCQVRLSVYAAEGCLHIEVYDTGMGMEPQELEQLRQRIYSREEETSQGRYSALHNIHSRVELMYGKPYGLSLESQHMAYMLARLTMPLDAQKGGTAPCTDA